jgi:acyl-CoA reductase-like NAD-dependent aldehyde dehydrogenase
VIITSTNPHMPDDVVLRAEVAGPQGVAAAVGRARDAFDEWSQLLPSQRSAALIGVADELSRRSQEAAGLVVREVGKPVNEAVGEVARAVAILRYYAQLALAPEGESLPAGPGMLLLTRRRPVGVCALLTPWNFPLAIPVWKLAPALASGNTVVMKPAPQASATALFVASILDAHLPPGTVEIVIGDAETGRPLVEAPVDAVSFTGSTPVGRAIVAATAARGIRVQAEMGGQNASIVLADADLERAADMVASAAMGFAGQKCTATSRVIVHDDVYDEFVDRLVASVESMEVTDPTSTRCQVGPLVSADARDLALAAIGRTSGRLLTGGTAIESAGFYIRPTLVALDDPADVLATEEVFAPVAAVLRVPTAERAVELANAGSYGLAAALYTSDLGAALSYAERLEAGMIKVNAPTTGVDFHAPFGGSKQSSYGPREQGMSALQFFTETVTVTVGP